MLLFFLSYPLSFQNLVWENPSEQVSSGVTDGLLNRSNEDITALPSSFCSAFNCTHARISIQNQKNYVELSLA